VGELRNLCDNAFAKVDKSSVSIICWTIECPWHHGAGVMTSTDTGLSPSTTYYYDVAAFN
jgi:hypothetical protein